MYYHLVNGKLMLAIIQVIFALSKDKSFEARGRKTRIPYWRHYTEYCEFLTSGLAAKARDVISIFELWNTTLFPNGIVRDAQVGKSRGFQEAMRLREEAASHNNPGGENETAGGSGGNA